MKTKKSLSAKVYVLSFILLTLVFVLFYAFTNIPEIEKKLATNKNQSIENELATANNAIPASIATVNSHVADFYSNFYDKTLSYNNNSLIDLTQNNNKKKGSVFISKQLLDQILSSAPTSNGVSVYMGWDGNNVKLFIKSDNRSETSFQISTNNLYELGSYCPPLCTF